MYGLSLRGLMKERIVVIGGAGHVGLPLSIALADASDSIDLTIYDINEEMVQYVRQGKMPFFEKGAEEKLRRVLGKNLSLTTEISCLREADIIIIVVGTPVDEHLNPHFNTFNALLNQSLPYLRSGQTVILRSTVFPGTTEKVNDFFQKRGIEMNVAFCPERIAEGKAMKELYSLPQIVSGCSKAATQKAKDIFSIIAGELVELAPLEAELAKLFTNSWRYIQFAAANQYYMLAEAAGKDFYKIYEAMTHNYPRLEGFPRAGFAAGPCLLKDTMQLSAFSGNQYFLGHSAMLVNEGLPNFIVKNLKEKIDLPSAKVGILGMAFKAESDDPRSSLSYKLRKILNFEAEQVLCTDEYIQDESFQSLEEVLEQADVLIIGTPHSNYKNLKTEKLLIDIWNFVEEN